jgi:hypothetical protein
VIVDGTTAGSQSGDSSPTSEIETAETEAGTETDNETVVAEAAIQPATLHEPVSTAEKELLEGEFQLHMLLGLCLSKHFLP